MTRIRDVERTRFRAPVKRALIAAVALVGLAPGTAQAIYGGEEAAEPYSFMASMQFKTSEGVQHWCGATLIAPQWVVTAKHCMLYLPTAGTPLPKPSDVQVRVGSLDRTTGGDLVDVTEFVVHGKPISPDPTAPQDTRGTDIALLKLARPVSAQPVEIADSPAVTDVRLLGWGYNCQQPRGHGCTLPTALRQLDTRTLPREGCVSAKPGDAIIADREICQAATPSGESIRPHDSGSPMVVRAGSGWRLIGAASGPVQQGADTDGTGPNIYTDVTAYRSWIAEHVR
ncbi:serine protease [Lentzea tibetensis]|uniref:Serine protease n=1 Tax=Lentzea tibetensis TaxID=2591470 RepID=A0A563EP28_9PSEU|nr:serine protease [Lentzea tibetensis]TWP49099.1 serine protease [Lentzea tibetensis]